MNIPLIDKKIADDVDSQGNALEIWHAEQLAGSRPFSLFLRTYAEISDSGFGSQYVSWADSNKCNVVYCVNDAGEILGGIAFEYRQLMKEGWIILSFTSPAHRGKGINQLMHKHFESLVKNKGCNKIASHVSVKNIPRLKAAQKVGFVPQYYRMNKFI
jgi:RimJ/RimL family protein N-acetyltransferase